MRLPDCSKATLSPQGAHLHPARRLHHLSHSRLVCRDFPRGPQPRERPGVSHHTFPPWSQDTLAFLPLLPDVSASCRLSGPCPLLPTVACGGKCLVWVHGAVLPGFCLDASLSWVSQNSSCCSLVGLHNRRRRFIQVCFNISFVYLLLCWLFSAARLCVVAGSGRFSPPAVCRLLLLLSTGSGSCLHELSCPTIRGISPHHGPKRCPLIGQT